MNDNIRYRFIDWKDVVASCNNLYKKMVADDYKPEVIVGLLRGGIIPARILCDYFGNDVSLFAIDIKLYNGVGKKLRRPIVRKFDEDLIRGRKIILVDDVQDSGDTMCEILNHLKHENIKTATLHYKEKLKIKPDYYDEIVDADTWLIYAWERNEFKREMSKLNKE